MEATTSPRMGRQRVRALAGAFDPRLGADAERQSRRVKAAVEREGSTLATHRGGALTFATAGREAQVELFGGCACAIAGSLYELDELASELGLAAGTSAERAVAVAYRRHGAAVLGRLRGDFTLLVWDEAAGRGLLARDQIGGGALFLCESGHELLFASELRNLLSMLARRPDPDPVAVVHWLALGGPPGERTFYEGVKQLTGGHYVELAPDGWRVARYWTPEYRTPRKIAPDEAAERLRMGLVRAVGRRSGAGERTGVMLSGGIDSAAVAGIAAHCGQPPIGAYSAVFPRHPAIDESRLIELLTESLGLRGRPLTVLGGSVIDGAADYIREWEVPSTSPNMFFWGALLRQAADDGVSAMLDGEGGDALFWLSPHLLADRLMHGRLLSAVSLARRFPSQAGHVLPRVVVRLLRDWGLRGAMPYRLHRLRRRTRGAASFAPSWFSQASAELRFDSDPALDWKRKRAPRWWSALLDGVTGVSATLVHDATRRRNAAVGIQARHPLLDVDLIELVLGLPPELAFDPRLSRPLLRESVRGLIPEQVRLRPTKSSFDAIFHELLSGPDLEVARSLLLAPDAEINAFVDRDRLRRQLFDVGPPPTAGALQTWALDVWRLLTAEAWLRHQAGMPLTKPKAR